MFKRVLVLMVAVLALALAGCGGGGGTTAPRPEIFFINASPDSGPLQLRFDDSVQVANRDYIESSNGFFEIDFKGQDVDGWDVSVHEQAAPNLELVRNAIVFNNNTDNVVLVHGLKNYGTEQLKRLRLANFTVDRTVVNGNRARLIVVHAMELATGAGTPGIVFKTPGDNAQFATSTIQPGNTGVITVDSGTRTWEVRRGGTSQVYTTQDLTFAPGGVYLIVVAGQEDSSRDISIHSLSLPTVQ